MLVIAGTGCVAGFFWFNGPLRLYDHFTRRVSSVEKMWGADPAVAKASQDIIAIMIERTGCFGKCPAYAFRIDRDGHASYDGWKYTELQGHLEGRFYGFDRLAYFAEGHILKLKSSYTVPETCLSTTILTVEMRDGVKRISDYGYAGPEALWIFCAALDGAASGIHWKRMGPANQPPEPTPTAVTPRADAQVSPIPALGHR